MKNNKSLKVLSTAAIAAALVAPTVAVQPAFAASSYTVNGVQTAAAGSTITDTVRIAVNLSAGTLVGTKTFQLRLPADSKAELVNPRTSTKANNVGVKQEVTTEVWSGATAAPKDDVTFEIKGEKYTVNNIEKGDKKEDVAQKIADAIKEKNTYDAEAKGAKIIIKAKNAENNDEGIKITGLAAQESGVDISESETTVRGVAANSVENKYVPTFAEGNENQVQSLTIDPVNPDGNGHAQIFDVTVTPDEDSASNKGIFYIELTNIKVPSGLSGALNATVDSKDSTFTNADLKIAQIGNGSVTTSVDGTVALTPGKNEDTVRSIRIKEDSAGAFREGDLYKLELPDGMTWSGQGTTAVVWGDQNAELKYVEGDGKDTIVFKVVRKGTSSNYETKSATQFSIDGLKVKVDDNDAQKGDVTVKIKGDVSRSNDSIVIGTFGTYEGEVKAGDAKTVYAGQTGETLGTVTIKEDAPGTLIKGRTLKLKLNGNAKWATKKDSNGDIVLKEEPQIKAADSDKNGLKLGKWELSGSDKTTIEAIIEEKSSTKPAKLVLERLKVDVAPTAGKGDISVSVEGTSGVRTDSVVVGKTLAPVEVSFDGELAKINTGLQQQSIPNIVIKEVAEDLIDKDNDLIVKFPDGVKPSLPGKVEVTEGNLKIDSAKVSVNDNKIIIPISKNSSSKGATIKLSDVKITSYRDVPEGDLKVKITGPSVVQKSTNDKKDGDIYPFNKPEDTHVAEGTVAKVVTPADKNKYAENIIFKIGSKTYTQDGKEMTMDVAPEVHPVYNRTYIPAAHFAASLNIPADKVVWNEASKTVTIFAGDKIVSATAGKKELVVNGTPVQIDAPVNYGQHTGYRVMVPYTHLALALGATVEWKADTQEIFVNKR
ncbi:copper amine oxidase N-terminal domain-containing protein [Aneurinibacillus aneurinilyticus]|uniref:copper amine oxidase N-terminal domain-containing protein n=1 Tax=Aneurinibacillus aneurinilyticus TaxID=1391 RepID=UPI00367279B0